MSADVGEQCLLSVIIPAFNAHSCLERAIRSAAPLLDGGNELIVINDGSSDDTSEIARNLAAEIGNIEVLNTENNGVAKARNAGIEIARGKWILFLDADDEIISSSCDDLKLTAQNERYDIVFGMKEYISQDGLNRYTHQELSEEGDALVDADVNAVLRSLLTVSDNSLSGSCTRALYRRAWLQDHSVAFPVGVTMAEDFCFLLSCIEARPKIGRQGILFYRVNQSNSSVTKGFIPAMDESMAYANNALRSVSPVFPWSKPLVTSNVAMNAWLRIDNSAKDELKSALAASKEVFSDDENRQAISSSWSGDRKSNLRRRILRLGLIAPSVPAILLRLKRRLEGF